MSWLTLSLLALFTFTGYDVLSRHLGVQSKDTRAFAGVYNLIAAASAVVLILIEPLRTPQVSLWVLAVTVVGLLIWGFFGRIEYFVHKHVEASTLTIIIKIAPVINFILSVLLFGESLTVSKILGLLLIVGANILVVGVPTAAMLRKDKGFAFALLLTVLLGLGWTFDKYLTPFYGIVLFTAMSFLAPAILSVVAPPVTFPALMRELRLGSWKIAVLALFNIVGYGFMLKALTLGEASKVIPIATSTTPLVIIAGAILLKETSKMREKFLACLLVLLGIYLLR